MVGLKQGLKSTPDWHIEDKRRQAQPSNPQPSRPAPMKPVT